MSQPGTRTVNGRTPAFSGDRAFLSNLFERPYVSRHFGIEVASSEHDFNAQKPVEADWAAWILAAPSPAEAKKRGDVRGKFTLRPGWDAGGRVRAMQNALLGKYADPELAALLVGTGTLHLVETNYWHDSFWSECFGGMNRCRPRCAQPGINMLGELLMALRSKIQTPRLPRRHRRTAMTCHSATEFDKRSESRRNDAFRVRVQAIVNDIELPPNFRLIFERDKKNPAGRFYLQVACMRPDTFTGEMAEGRGGKSYLTEHVSKSEVVLTVWGLFQNYVMHEAREGFLYKGRRPFGPHIDIDALWSVAGQLDARQHLDLNPTQNPSQGTLAQQEPA